MMRYFTLIFFSVLVFSSCKVFRSNLMLKTPKDFAYDKLVDSLSMADYKLAPNDVLVYRVLTKNGFDLINLSTTTGNFLRSDLDVAIESDGSVKMPLIGRISLAGQTVKEAEKTLEKAYSENYVDPFITIKVTNKRVIVFPGNGGSARVLPLTNNNTTVMEAIAGTGGIMEDGKAYKVKLIRTNADPTQKPYVYLMDLSRIEGLAYAKSKVQAGDIIYVEPRYRPVATTLKEFTPVLTLLTSLLIIYQFYRITNP